MDKMPKNAKEFVCEDCDFKCYKKSNYDAHILTSKHKNRTNPCILEQKMLNDTELFFCKKCDKSYKARNSLWYHEKKCNLNYTNENTVIDNKNDETQELKVFMKYLMEENSEMKSMMMEVIKNGTYNNLSLIHI